MVQEILRVPGMRVERDRQALLGAVRAVAGVRRVMANLADHTLRIEREDELHLAAILRAVSAAGYEARVLV